MNKYDALAPVALALSALLVAQMACREYQIADAAYRDRLSYIENVDEEEEEDREESDGDFKPVSEELISRNTEPRALPPPPSSAREQTEQTRRKAADTNKRTRGAAPSGRKGKGKRRRGDGGTSH